MKNLTFNLLLLLCGLCSFAQTGAIEVTVTDTVWMKPTSFEYLVEVTANEGWTIYPPLSADSVYNEEADAPQKQQHIKDLKAFLTKKKYTFKEPQNPMPGLGHLTPEGIVVTLTTTKDLKRLKADIKTLDYAQGHLGGAQFGDEALYDTALYTKLVNRARAKAQAIATASGLKPGKILEVKEVEQQKDIQDLNIYDVYFVFSKGRVFEDEKGNVHGELTRTITVKFAAE
ncbi:hypothetical protein AM493_14015 [Flavobacterium akiainvivens]|uniref:SIMPL domain-containing protein n=1 Tax=Flavobacterium akiainvivens TaxID=1202724 RepID=A0A0M8MAH1_9FLAO|nr:SIMPL domain-containing protein [Flavobacterium akiainvivens]KOS07023.1 hypothetical protein AM493_14015 [Flavobacterium akiainvivens]SFQ59047.1 Protein of unknown function [Flavobacterium akiainvivens]